MKFYFNRAVGCTLLLLTLLFTISGISKPEKKTKFKILAFYTGKNDQAHISFVREANNFFQTISADNNFTYNSTSDWSKLNTEYLSGYQVVLFLDTRPETQEQRTAFQKYMENGGAWMGFHFAAFALTPSAFNQNWDWYHEKFLGSGQYASNTWRPTSAILRVEDKNFGATKNLPEIFKSSPNEWYRWEHDLRKNPDIKILVSIDSTSFPLGTGPKQHEIWHSGYFPVVWTNKNYKMLYLNMGHNDIDYENKTNKTLSYTFDNDVQNKLVVDGILWLGSRKK
ncbi:Trehalose utilisation [Dyadobacter koreensis]|uniref:Trehalose utilisation n=1 Tax=Dyadobacter koreensis TaxID=408657 RepID=A0A1H6VCV6_9BACT|nr:ThuA domain-containing protein [Dyadobacter koreensis]SEJ00814.1 Trehalose utilisation [Dyadobacter koreensis]